MSIHIFYLAPSIFQKCILFVRFFICTFFYHALSLRDLIVDRREKWECHRLFMSMMYRGQFAEAHTADLYLRAMCMNKLATFYRSFVNSLSSCYIYFPIIASRLEIQPEDELQRF